ncbi:uncharacterized protein EAF02_004358 [Botrytis sinoallii]|uniref:uncharacterized protein n=1 Tax=Botrytis sinoallii TaxID=1463999 RepID=UPI0019014144|nr:uncharacterized protein EAF02_004358 [Botrytis sinoallii]KAF7885849.1 hypothetical protein EAF02_004358 [Botrytis sinoallii]
MEKIDMSHNSLPDFEYSPIPTVSSNGNSNIRVLQILPSPYSHSSINTTLVNATLGESEPYEALSYCWGDASVKVPITVNGKKFDVTTNLFAAMQKLRKTDVNRRIWIDAICINQNDNDEKNTQVRLMREIYQKTERCLVWLGEFRNAKPVTTMFDLIRKGRELKSASDIKNLPPKDKYRFWESLGLLDIDDSAWETVNDIMTAPWWNRVWVIQEITFPKEVMVFCGDEEWDWDEMVELGKFVMGSSSWVSFDDGNLNININWGGLKQLSDMRSEKIQPLHKLLLAFRGRGATDPRDNIFALLSMDFDQGEITVPLRAADLWARYMEKSYDLDEFSDKFLKTPLKDLSEKDYSMSFRVLKAFLRAKEAYTKYCSAYGINFVLEGSELRREQDSSPLLESVNNRRSQGNDLRRKMRHSNPIDSIRLPGNGTQSTPHESPSEEQSLHADYNMDIARVYTMTMQRLLYDGTDLDLLIEIDHSLANTYGLPSWVIDWTVSDVLIGRYDIRTQYSATCDSQLSGPPEMSGTEIRLEGYQVETIRHISQSLLIYGYGEDIPSYLKWKEFITEILGDVVTAEELERIFYETILGRTQLSSDRINRFEKVIQIIMEAESEEERKFMSGRLLEEHKSASRDLAFSAMNCENREIIVTDKGKVGLAPATAAIGDRIFLFRGGCMPFVLREKEWKGKEREVEEGPPKQVTEQDLMLEVMKTILEIKNIETTSPDESPDAMQNEQGKASKWELIGNCYINGMMDGEEWVESRCDDVTLV